MKEQMERDDLTLEDLKKVEAESAAKMLRHRVDDYVAIILGVGAVVILWIMQSMGLY